MKILVAVDASQHAWEAVRVLERVHWPEASHVYLLHVIEMKHAASLTPTGESSSWDRVIGRAREQLMIEARLFLEHTQKKLRGLSGQKIVSLVVEGLPGAEILEAVKIYHIDLVILGSRGLSGIKRFLLGSTSEWVMREASCSVLLVRGKLRQATMGKAAAKVLLATDGSPEALNTMPWLRLLMFKTPPKVTVMHVVAKPAYLEGWYWGKGKAEFLQLADQLQEKAREDGARHLDDMSQKVKGLNMKVESLLTKGNPADIILQAAERLKPKLIIVGAQKCSESQSMPVGDIARKVVRYASCSVLIARPGTFQPVDT